MTLPSNLDASTIGSYQLWRRLESAMFRVNGRTVTVTFELSDPSSIRTYSDLERIDTTQKDETHHSSVTIDSNVAAGTQLTAVVLLRVSLQRYC